MPVFHRGFRTGWWGWPRGYDVWAVPYTQSTLIVDVIDAHTNQLVWRGNDVDTLNTGHPDKTLSKAVDNGTPVSGGDGAGARGPWPERCNRLG